jgi:hypothetical protein
MGEAQSEHWHELWGTFSVKDHCRPGAFVAEVLTYDKLMIPIMPTSKHGLSEKAAEDERERWKEWKPDRQREIVKILGDAAEAHPWTAARQAEWQQEMEREVADARRNGYFVTGSVLEKLAPARAKTMVAVSRYHNLDELKRVGIRLVVPEEKLPASNLLAVLGYELLMPNDPEGGDDFESLREAVKVAKNDEYRIRRRALYEWQQDFLASDGMTDASSIREAVKQMSKLVDRLKMATDSQTKWKWARRCFFFLGMGAKAAPIVNPALALPAGAVGVLASGLTLAIDQSADDRKIQGVAIPAATLILDARERLGIE